MHISEQLIRKTLPECDIYNEVLSLDGECILELGCGRAEFTRAIATEGHDRKITALEVDELQHKKNILIDDLPNVSFKLDGAEAISMDDESYDIVLMFKSLHHVPVDLMDQAFREIHRVLKPGGIAYISEPIFMGSFNDILRLFHDEQLVREKAFNAIEDSVDSGLFKLVDELFFNTPVSFDSFNDFEDKIIKVTHTRHQLSDETYAAVKQLFMQYLETDGAHFITPMRVDLLRKI